jgi:hypothetical protein
MKPAQLEIMLFTDTHFSSMQLCEKKDTNDQISAAKNKSLEEACWDGLCLEMLEGLYEMSPDDKLILWKIIQAEHFLSLEYGGFQKRIDGSFSLNPYLFLRFDRLT